jgi:uncharacterized protein (TIGR02145 family)
VFTGWAGAVIGATTSVTITMDGNKELTASFQQHIVIPPGGGDENTFTDTRDGKTYRYVTIGNQTWMAENLNYQTPEGSWCYGRDNSNCEIYGRLYNWTTAMNVSVYYNNNQYSYSGERYRGNCPLGWHLPSPQEWNILEMTIGSSVSTTLKSANYWTYDSDHYIGTDIFGFSALPGGRVSDGYFNGVGSYGYWWTTTEMVSVGAIYRGMNYNSDAMIKGDIHKYIGHSVRCVRDN